MKLLLTNDDGIDSPGLHALETALGTNHEVIVVAPNGDRSGVATALTLTQDVALERHSDRRFSLDGTPADCILLGIEHCCGMPDAVISGINIGLNVGADLNYSGTAGAARQAAMMGIPAIATSSRFGPSMDFTILTEVLVELLGPMMELWTDEIFFNINAPGERPVAGIRIAGLSGLPKAFRPSDLNEATGTIRYRRGPFGQPAEDGTDWHLVNQGYVAISPVLVLPQNHPDPASFAALESISVR